MAEQAEHLMKIRTLAKRLKTENVSSGVHVREGESGSFFAVPSVMLQMKLSHEMEAQKARAEEHKAAVAAAWFASSGSPPSVNMKASDASVSSFSHSK